MGRPGAAQTTAAAAAAATAGSGRTPSRGPRGASRRATTFRRADRRCKIEIQRPGQPRHASVQHGGTPPAAWCQVTRSSSKDAVSHPTADVSHTYRAPPLRRASAAVFPSFAQLPLHVADLSGIIEMQEPEEKRKTAGETSFLPSSKGIVLRSEGAPHQHDIMVVAG